jgi:hypothetical protein
VVHLARRCAVATSLLAWSCTIVGDLGRDSGSAGGSASGSEGSSSGDSGSDVDTTLPALPELTNVRVRIVGDAANVTFDPVDDAIDYRIYPLPADDDITVGEDGMVVVDRALYRCAGQREALYMLLDTVNPDPGWNDNAAGGATVLSGAVEGFTRSDADAQLGHVYLTEGSDRIPVYVLGDVDSASEASLECGRPVFDATRPKSYTTDPMRRDELVAEGWRDDGIAFFVPSASASDTRPVYEAALDNGTVLRWVDGSEATARGPGTPIFHALVDAGEGTAPLMRAHVVPYCARAHDELVATLARHRKVRRQGDQPLPSLRWSGLTGPTILVAEALDSGCPYQGLLSPQAEPAFVDEGIAHEAWVTPEEMRAGSPTGEVFIDGQHEGQAWPKAVRRSFIEVAPEVPELPEMDFFATFAADEDLRATFGGPTGDVYAQHFDSPAFMLSSYANSHVHFGSMLGELFVAYNDIAAGVNGSIRITAHEQTEVADGGYLHVTTELDVVTTDRRFSQLMVSDQLAPVQDNLALGTTLIVSARGYAPSWLQLQICDHQTWDLGQECPRLPTFAPDVAPPVRLPAESAGSGASMQLDIYLSPTRIYLLTDGQPYACTDLPAVADDGIAHGPPTGAVTVTWGDVLAHSAIDFQTGGGPITAPDSYAFHRAHLHTTTRRRFDNIGFVAHVDAPPWDETRVPCVGG